MDEELTNLEQLLDRINEAATGLDRISLEKIISAVGSRSFGPLLLLVGVILFSPLSGIPGMPTVMGLLVLLIAVQLLFRRKHFWLPRWLLKRSVEHKKLQKALKWLGTPARFIDRWIRPRLTLLIRGISVYFIAVICFFIAVALPVMEILPFSASAAGAILTAFGLSLIAHDGFPALLAFVLTIMTFAWIMSGFI